MPSVPARSAHHLLEVKVMRVTRVRETRDQRPGACLRWPRKRLCAGMTTGRPGPEGWRAKVKNAVLR